MLYRFYTLFYGAIASLGQWYPPIFYGTLPTVIYGRFPDSPIALRATDKYDQVWTFPTDYHLESIHNDSIHIAVALDVSGCMKIYQYNPTTMSLLIDDYWAAEVTKEGTIIWFGPQNDPSPLGEICIIAPFGWGLEGLPAGETLDVVKMTDFSTGNWQVYSAMARQLFTIVYGTKVMTQETTWDTDTDAPCVKTRYAGENLTRFDIKEYAPYWYQGTHKIERTYEYVKNPVFDGVEVGEIQYVTVKALFKSVIDKYNADTGKFDKYRFQRP